MADRTVRAIFEARVSAAKKSITGFGKDVADAGKKVDGLTKDLKTLDGLKVKPDVEVELDKAKTRLGELVKDLADLKTQEPSVEVEFKIEQAKSAIKDVRALVKDLTSQTTEVKIDAATKDAQKRISDITTELGLLRTMEVTPEVTVQIKDAQKKLRDAKAELRELNGAKAEVKVTADTSSLKGDLKADLGDAGDEAGDEAGGNIATGILDALRTIPIAGAVVGVGAAIAGGILGALKDGLQVEVERDLFSARTGLDEATSARFGRAVGEAYGNAWGESVEANLDTARTALQAGLIDADATDAEIEQVIASLSGLTEIMGTDIPETARAAGVMIRTGIAKTSAEAFDVLVAGYQNGANASDDLIDTFTEYPALFAKLGLSGDEAMGLITQGLNAGARSSDLAADALKEFQIRATDGSKLSAEGFKAIGLNAETMTAQIAKGGEGAKKGLDQVLDGLRAMKDPVEQNAAGVALFGTQWEDLGNSLLALDVTTAVSALGSVAGSAGAAEKALATMSDNAASKIESAKRNISLAADGIKGALAEAFSDEIGGAADWVSKNRAPLMEFFLDVINGTIDMGIAFAGFSASALEGIAGLADGLASLINVYDFIPGIDLSGAVESLNGLADSARNGAETLRTEVPAALESTRDSANAWAAPEIIKARIHDATAAMAGDMDAFSAKVESSGGTVTINGDKLTAEQALAELTANIDGSDGTVTINGNKVPADQALSTLIALINAGKGTVTVGGNTTPAGGELSRLMSKVDASRGTVDMLGNAVPGLGSLAGLMSRVNRSSGSVKVNAATSAAERAINYAARDRFSTIRVNYSDGGGVGGIHEGGRVTGLNAGGRVPGSDPGHDNVLWPLNMGGRTLQQPLAGGEYVVNSKDAGANLALLEYLNAGGKVGGSGGSQGGSMAISGTLDIPGIGPSFIRGVVQQELSSTASRSRRQGVTP